MTIGIPQGSILGPLLFLIYISDLPNFSTDCNSVIFADDTVLCYRSSDKAYLVSTCNNELDKFNIWAVSNRLSINVNKTNYMFVTNRRINTDNAPNVHISSNHLNSVDSVTYLGVILDCKLKYDQHIRNISSKISKSLGVMYRIKRILNTSALKSLYYALIHPYLNYCNLIWSRTYPSHLIPLFILQKKSLRIINDVDYFHPSNPLFKSSNILKLNELSLLNLAIFMYKNIDRYDFNRGHDYHMRSYDTLRPTFQRLTSTQQSVSYAGPILWNSIPSHIKDNSSVEAFKSAYKKHLFSTYNSS